MVLAYPDFDKTFEIYTGVSAQHLGAVITQGNRPITFFSQKLSEAQKQCAVTEQELFAIVETSKEFKGMLWGQNIKVYTDHNNIKQDALGMSSDKVYWWRLLLEKFAAEIVYLKGINNTVADAISRLDFTPPARLETGERKGKGHPENCHTAFIQSFPDENGVNITQLKWKAISKCFNTMSFNNSTSVDSNKSITIRTHRNVEECVRLSLYGCGQEEQEEIYPTTVSEISDS